MREIRCPDESSTEAVGRRLGERAHAGAVIALIGALGVGKSVLARGVARGLGIVGRVPSPTFVLVHLHERGRLPLAHVDLYRLGSDSELAMLGLDDARARGALTVIEWADRFPDEIPADRLEIEIAEDAGGRVLRIRATGPEHRALEAAA